MRVEAITQQRQNAIAGSVRQGGADGIRQRRAAGAERNSRRREGAAAALLGTVPGHAPAPVRHSPRAHCNQTSSAVSCRAAA